MMRYAHAAALAVLLLGMAPTTAIAQADGTQPQPRASWTADRRAFSVGDVITVVVDEHTMASANNSDFASDRRSRDMSVGVTQNVSPAIPNVRAGVGSSNDAESRQRGEATRQNRFRGEMTARVVEVGPNGLLRIEGTKSVQVDRAREELSLAGWVRPQDVSSRNTIDSWRVGDAKLVYSSTASQSPRGGIIGRMVGKIWP